MSESNYDVPSGAVSLPDYEELNIVNTNSRHQYHRQRAHLHHQEDDHEYKNLVLTRFHQQVHSPRENLKQLRDKQPATKVTRLKTKLSN